MKYSVIIPVYNAAATIGRCLDSLLNQPHENAEILLINDGSTDSSGEICRCYARNNGCVRYFEKENGGVSSARNLGLDMAAGEYILFVDSDDYVTPDYFAVINQAVAQRDPDMLMFGLKCFGRRNDVWQTGEFFGEDPIETAKFVRNAVRAYLYSNLMTRTFRRSIICASGLRFDETLMVGEDYAFVFAYTMHMKRVVSIEKVLYRYSLENEDSLSLRKRSYLDAQLLRVSRLVRESLQQSTHHGYAYRIYQDAVAWVHYRSVYSACKELWKFDFTAAERRKRIRQICRDYSRENVRPAGFRTWLIALPVLGRLSCLIDSMTAHSEYCRKLVR